MENRDLGLLTMGNKYLSTSSLIFTELIKSGNIWILESTEDNYHEITKRSDFNISIPTLFLFFHGLETTMKGLLLKLGEVNNKNHKISFYYKELKSKLNKGNPLIKILEKYIIHKKMNSILISFLGENKKPGVVETIDSFYDFLKYPFDKDESIIYDYSSIKYQEEDFLPFAKEIVNDIDLIKRRNWKNLL